MGMSELDIDTKEEVYENAFSDSEYLYKQFEDAIYYLEIFGEILNVENEYADYITATQYIEEYQTIVTIHSTNESFNEEVEKRIESLQTTIIELADKLQEEVNKVPLSEKKLISVKEFEIVYSVSVESQRKLRKRLKDPLPFIQIESRGNVLYNHKEVDKWFENYTNEGK